MVQMIRSNILAIKGLNTAQRLRLEKVLTFSIEKRGKNHIYYENYPAFHYYPAKDATRVPRGFEYYLEHEGILDSPHPIEDRTACPTTLTPIVSDIELRSDQQGAVGIGSLYNSGVIKANPGWGKTVVAIKELICHYQTPTLIIVKTKDLLTQWINRIVETTNLSKTDIGIMGNGNWAEEVFPVTVATWQTLNRRLGEIVDGDVSKRFGLLICDEAHGFPAQQVERVVRSFHARHLWGLTATPFRSDNLSRLINYIFGPVRFEGSAEDKVPVFYKQISIPDTKYKGAGDWQDLSAMISNDVERSAMISQYIVDNVLPPALIICNMKNLVELIHDYLKVHMPDFSIIDFTGDTNKKGRKEILNKGYRGEIDYVITTTLGNEGLDWPPLRSICFAFPNRFSGRIIQQTGRLTRSSPGKDCGVIYDFVDKHPITFSQARSRKATYMREGYMPLESLVKR